MAEARRYRFLLAIDGSKHARRAAQYVALRAAALRPAEVVLVNVQAPDKGAGYESAVAEARALLDDLGIPVTVDTVTGDPVRKILEATHRHACDEIVLGSRGAGAIERLALGSVAYKVAHLAPQPVTVVPNPNDSAELDLEDNAAHRILLAVDGSKTALVATRYVCGLRDSLVPLHVSLLNVQLPVVSRQISRHVAKSVVEAYLHEEGSEALAASAQALRDAGLRPEPLVRIGQIAASIVLESQLLGCTRIVMGGRGMGALSGVVLGSTALQVLHLSELPVTLVK